MSSSSSSSSAAAAATTSGCFATAISLIVDLCIVFLSHIGYVVQYVDIVRTSNIEGYASLVSLILLTSNTLRVFYYVGKHFARALLFQSLVALLVHGALLIKVLQVHGAQLWSEENADQPPLAVTAVPVDATEAQHASQVSKTVDPDMSATEASKPNTLDALFAVGGPSAPAPSAVAPTSAPHSHVVNPNEFILFRLEDMLSETFLRHTPMSFLYTYGVTSACVFLFILVVIYGLLGVPSVVGYVSMGIEAMMVMPQILRNARRKSTQGLTMFLAFSWVFGDLTKIIYFFVKSQPLPFILCGFIQIGLDAVVVAQIWMYRTAQQAQFLSSGLQGIGSETP